MQVRKQQLVPDVNKQNSLIAGVKGGVQAVFHPSIHFCAASHVNAGLDEAQAGVQVDGEKYQQPQILRWYQSNGRKLRGTNEPLDESERGEGKSWLKI